ncbi:MAG: 23S rRNA (uracil(1939)-C(5))-methyltransferase RlmD [Clostridiales bacterium]|nr:23S rRNA (uracil(1939)-C(5))-methyltransferase RlmD [Clostridiales bacterium]
MELEKCKHSNDCGGCIYQGVPYQEQLELKAKLVLNLLKENNITYDRFLGIEGSPKQFRYRNKMEYTFGDEEKGGEMTLGLHKLGRFMSIITTDQCQLVDDDFNKVLRKTLSFCKEKGYPFYHKKTHKGLMRHLVLRKGENTKELLINIITTTQAEFDREAYVKAIEEIELENLHIVGILHTENDRLSDAVNCDRMTILKGRDYYNEELLGLTFKVSAFSFFQPNVLATEKIYTEAISMIDDLNGKTVFDLYSGTGTISQAIARSAKQVIGIEIVEEAVEAAKENAKINGLDNCKFIAGDVLKVLDEIEEKPDCIVMDPPRSGIVPKALNKILKYGVNQTVYVSCNPKTMAQNLATAIEQGYKVNSVKVFDNFPNTKHVETVALMSKK